jgi:hypothetical protein
MKRSLLGFQIDNHLFGSVNREVVANCARYLTKPFNRMFDLDALFTPGSPHEI